MFSISQVLARVIRGPGVESVAVAASSRRNVHVEAKLKEMGMLHFRLKANISEEHYLTCCVCVCVLQIGHVLPAVGSPKGSYILCTRIGNTIFTVCNSQCISAYMFLFVLRLKMLKRCVFCRRGTCQSNSMVL